MPNGSFDWLTTLSNIEGPISVRPAILADSLEEVPTTGRNSSDLFAVPSGA